MGSLRFGVITITNVPWAELARRWEQAEAVGLDSAWTCDHLGDASDPGAPWLEGQATLAALAARTSRIRVGCMVLSMTHRNPAVLARQAATIDHVSGGRHELGLGSGGSALDHELSGVPQWTAKERAQNFDRWVRRLLELMERFEPKPVHGRMPVTIGGQGPTALRLAAELGDRWNTYGGRGLSGADAVRAIRANNDRLDELCARHGRDPATLTRSLLAGARRFIDDPPFASAEAFHDYVGRYAEAGVDEFIFYVRPSEWGGGRDDVFDRVLADTLPAYR